jgi:hypothetical protein
MFVWPSIETSARAKANEFRRAHQSTASNDSAFKPRFELDFDIKIRVRLRPKFFVAISITQ